MRRNNRGKSSGYRVIYFFRTEDIPIQFVTLFGKNEKANITPAERRELIALCDRLVALYRRNP